MRFPLTQRSFRGWLKGRKPSEVIGVSGKASDCPCQRCIVDTRPDLVGGSVYVQTMETQVYEANGKWHELANPDWLTRFVRDVDRDGYAAPITVKRAREAFRKATRPKVFA